MKTTAMAMMVVLGMATASAHAQRGVAGRPGGIFRSGGTQRTLFNGRTVTSQSTSFMETPAVTQFGGQTGPVTSILPIGQGIGGDPRNRREYRRHHRRDNQDQFGNNGAAAYPETYYFGDYGNNAQNGGYIGPKYYRQPNAYTGPLGYAGPNGYAAPDGYAGPYGYPFDNPVWWDQRFHHPYRPR